jgi:hypothetical protein
MHENIQEHFLKRFENASADPSFAVLLSKHVGCDISRETASAAYERLRRGGGGKTTPSLAICVVALKDAAKTTVRVAPRIYAPEPPKPARTPEEIQRVTDHLAKFWKSIGGKPTWAQRKHEAQFRTEEQKRLEAEKLEAMKGQPIPPPSPELVGLMKSRSVA